MDDYNRALLQALCRNSVHKRDLQINKMREAQIGRWSTRKANSRQSNNLQLIVTATTIMLGDTSRG